MNRAPAILFIFLIIPCIASALPQDMIAPPVLFNLHPLYTAGAQPLCNPAQTAGEGKVFLKAAISYGNNYIVEGLQDDDTTIDLELDSEGVAADLSARIGLNSRSEFIVGLQASGQYGGFLDPIINGFHNLFGFPNGGRELRDPNETSFIVYQDHQTILETDDNLGSLYMTLEPRLLLFQDKRVGKFFTTMSLGLWSALPLFVPDHPLAASKKESFKAGIRCYLAVETGPYFLQASGSLAGTSTPRFLDSEDLDDLQVLFDFTIGRYFGEEVSAKFSVSGTTSPFHLGYERTDTFSAVFLLGGCLRTSPRDTLDFGFSEEFFTFAATDIGFHISWSHRTGGR